MERRTTIQINIRVSKPLIDEIDIVSRMLKIDRTEWIRLSLAKIAFEERNRLMKEMSEVEKYMDAQMQKELQDFGRLAKKALRQI